MTSFYKTITAVCLVASSGLQSVAGSSATYKWTAEDVTAEAYLSVNLARNGKLPVHINEVATDTQLVDSLKEIVADSEDTRTGQTCNELIKSKELKDLFYSVVKSQGEPDYRQLLQASLDEGLKVFESSGYPSTGDGWTTIWQDKNFANLAYLLNSNSTKVGCVIGKCTAVQSPPQGPTGRETGNQAEMAVLLCDLDPPATKNQAPFDEDYFTGLIARKAKLTDMTTDDLKATNDGTAAAAVPTIMFAGLVAMLTAVSA
ncbi:SAG family member [Eimeria brunetti]|uniref:SAG family member n=1 Tax=Eimeria brunetti TaxID=51314 RepID=U6L8S1_9EIME|nr:SAG family member [Eimeria brunetti]